LSELGGKMGGRKLKGRHRVCKREKQDGTKGGEGTAL